MELKEVRCTVCGAPIEEHRINIKAGKAVCSHCGTVFRFTGGGTPAAPGAEGIGFTIPKDAAVAMPRGFSAFRDEKGLHIKRKWYSPQILFFLFFCIFWDGALAFWFILTLSGQFGIIALFGLLHGAIGIGITYYVVCGFVNTTMLSIGGNEVALFHRPLPWPGAFRCRPEEIDFFEYLDRARTVVRSFTSAGADIERIGSGAYLLRVFFSDGSRKTVFTGIPSERHAAYLQRMIEEEIYNG